MTRRKKETLKAGSKSRGCIFKGPEWTPSNTKAKAPP